MTRRTLAGVSAGLGRPSSTRLRDHAHDVVDNLLTGFPSAALRQAVDAVAGADGVIAVTPIFSGSCNTDFAQLLGRRED